MRLAPVCPPPVEAGERKRFGYVRRLDLWRVIGKIEEVKLLANFGKSQLDLFEKRAHPLLENLFDSRVAHLRFHLADEPIYVVGVAVRRTAGNTPQRLLRRADRKGDAAREAPVEYQEAEDVIGIDLREINLAERFQGAATFQHGHPLDDVHRTADQIGVPCRPRRKHVIFYVDKPRGVVGPLQILADLHEGPPLVVRKGVVGDPLKEVRGVLDLLVEAVGITVHLLRRHALQEVVEVVELLPHFARNTLDDAPLLYFENHQFYLGEIFRQ